MYTDYGYIGNICYRAGSVRSQSRQLTRWGIANGLVSPHYQTLFATSKGGCIYIISDRRKKRKVVIMAKKMNVLQKIDNGILQVKELQRKVEQNTIIEKKAIQLISECRFKEAMKLLERK